VLTSLVDSTVVELKRHNIYYVKIELLLRKALRKTFLLTSLVDSTVLELKRYRIYYVKIELPLRKSSSVRRLVSVILHLCMVERFFEPLNVSHSSNICLEICEMAEIIVLHRTHEKRMARAYSQ